MLEFRNKDNAVINANYKPADKLQNDRKSVYKRYHDMRNSRQDYNGANLEEIWNKSQRQYELWRPARSADDWQSNIVPPFTTSLVEKALAEIVDQVIRPTIVPRGPEDVQKAKLLNHIVDYTWEIGDGDLELYHAIKQALIFGKTIWQEDFFLDKREVKVMKKFDPENAKEEYVKKNIYDFNNVYGETVNLFDFYIDPSARTINRGKYKANDAIRRYIMDYDTFMERFKDGPWDQFGATRHVRPGGDTNYYQFYTPPQNTNREDDVEVLFYWGRRPDKLIIVANDVVIRDGPNPYNHKQLPFAEGSDVPLLSQFYSMGEPRLLESVQDELNTLRRMRIDRQHLDIWKMFLVSNRETLDEDDAIVRPSRFMFVEDTASVKALEYGDINPSAYREEELLKMDGREVTGVLSPQPTSTATEAAIHKESTMRALRLKIWLMSRELVTNIIRLRVPNIVQFYTVPMVEEIVGKQKVAKYRSIRTTDVKIENTRTGEIIEKDRKGEHFFEVKPEMITPQYGGYDLKLGAEPSLPISKPLLQQKTNELMQHPVIAAAVEQGIYDLGKVSDLMMDVNEYDPEKLKPQMEGEEPEQFLDTEQIFELANRENEIITKGKRVPPTAYAPRQHTEIHLAYMESEEFKRAAANEEILQNMAYHILGEEKAQQMREGGMANGQLPQQGQQGPPGQVPQGIEAGQAKATSPARMQGAEGVPPVV